MRRATRINPCTIGIFPLNSVFNFIYLRHACIKQPKIPRNRDRRRYRYKRENVAERIRELAPKGINVVFENVGGEILEASLQNIALRARIVLSDGISGYNAVYPNATPASATI